MDSENQPLVRQLPAPEIGFYEESDWKNWTNYLETTKKAINETFVYLDKPVIPNAKIDRNRSSISPMKSNLLKLPQVQSKSLTMPRRRQTPESKIILPPLVPLLTPKSNLTLQRLRGDHQLLPNRAMFPNHQSLSASILNDKSNLRLATPVKSMDSLIVSSLREKFFSAKKIIESDMPTGRKYSPPEQTAAGKSFSRPSSVALSSKMESISVDQNFNQNLSKHNSYSTYRETPRILSSPFKNSENVWKSDGRVARRMVTAAGQKNQVLDDDIEKLTLNFQKIYLKTPEVKRTPSSSQFPLKRSVSTLHLPKNRNPSPSPTTSTARKCSSEMYAVGGKFRFTSVEDALKKLESQDWEANIDGFNAIVVLAKENFDAVRSELSRINIAGWKHLANLRSQVCRAACQFFFNMFTIFGRGMEQDIDKLSGRLLEKSSDTNKFIRQDAFIALEAMVEHLSPNKTLFAIDSFGTKHRNAIIRTTTAKLTSLIIKKIGAKQALAEMPDKILQMLTSFLQEGSLETRTHGKEAIGLLIRQSNFESLLHRHISVEVLRNVHKSIESVRREVNKG